MIVNGIKRVISIKYGGHSTITKIFNGIIKVYETAISVFGAGYWINDESWNNEDAWKNQ